MSRVFIYGARGHGKVVADVLMRSGETLGGFIDDDPALRGHTVLGLPVVDGGWAVLEEQRSLGVSVALGIGNNAVRQRVAERCLTSGFSLFTAIHPAAVVAESARIGDGSAVMAGAVINPCAQIGRGVIINSGAIVEHDVEVGAWAHLSPHATTGGEVRIGEACHIGLGATILPGVTVGPSTVVGAGAVVNRDLPGGVVAFGVPAHVHRSTTDR